MFGYRHAFHAGNHADVLKHLVLVQLLDYYRAKQKPFWYVDTHCGAGAYRLDEGPAQARGEYRDGIGRLWDRTDLPPATSRYLELVGRFNPDGKLNRYPGSAWFASEILGPADRLWLFELLPADFQALRTRFSADSVRTRVQCQDGFAALRGLLPPASKRALVLLDPSYELAEDYARVVDSLADSLRRFSTGTYALWYPLLRRREADRLPRQLGALAARAWLNVRLMVRRRPLDEGGLYGSGLYVINPPYTLPAMIEAELPAVAQSLAQDDKAGFTLDFEIP
ncbi:MAG: 23S rRNA (adenine(2030)-N(6))-methyltransferase RlmJ [Gammaproteobacteria bacterium]|nr:23S rRNA (adenine(2030)-N(6))-methyltransferase RlmJ [Gammaproteobacteria bacterium]MDH4255264.1 23S rRNA (adenine(2030)-N(6))-methyltransferase RlmJ [Gammaproteobacteria bacterium]MDH5309996.1 23S rRNA (adenine(2030)-N(6))-methyltransferase RlmJ [Gammaproteobacteria bacterium]